MLLIGFIFTPTLVIKEYRILTVGQKSINGISVSELSSIIFIRTMATPLLAETIRCKRGKDKLVILGFIYTLNKSNGELYHWVCENRGHCKARLSSKINLSIVKPKDSNGIIDSHTHGPDMSRIEMLKGYDLMRERADHISDESTRAIFASGVDFSHHGRFRESFNQCT